MAARWQSGYAGACKAPYVGSIPARASNLPKPAEARRPAGYFRPRKFMPKP